MKIDVMTLFPEMFETFIHSSIIGRAVDVKGLVEINAVNIRDFSESKQKKVDDAPYGGGNGMIMTFQPIYNAYKYLTDRLSYKPKVIYMSPQGEVLTQKIAHELSGCSHLILLCGHYEGVDERIIDEIVDEEVSIGDYILTGGELPAMVLIDSIVRLLPGALSSDECFLDESHSDGFLEYPQYTRPEVVNGRKVPEVLLSGHHKNIAKWRKEKAFERTKQKRPDLINSLDKE